MPVQKHTHRLKKHKYKTGIEVYFCTLPDCYFKIDCAFTVGKKFICNLCGDEFTMTEKDTKLTRPHCNNCAKVKIKDSDGRNRYVRKTSIPILDSIAENKVDSLRSRLDNAISTKEDI